MAAPNHRDPNQSTNNSNDNSNNNNNNDDDDGDDDDDVGFLPVGGQDALHGARTRERKQPLSSSSNVE